MVAYWSGWARSIALGGAALALAAGALAAPPVAGPNVNMVSGTKWPAGDPFLTKQNEPSLAVSSRNSRHLLAASNDYRLVPVAIADKLDDPEAWIQIYKSVDGGATWRSTPLGGCPINIPECNDSTTGLTAALKAKGPNFGADPTVRPGPYGTFFVSHIAGTRDSGANGVVGVQRFVDKDNDIQRVTDVRACPAGRTDCTPVYVSDSCKTPGCATKASDKKVKPTEDPILPDVYNIIDSGTPGQFKDKPWVVADVPGRKWNSKKQCTLLGWTKGRSDVADASESVPAFNVYVSYANFTGQSPSQHPEVYVATSIDCGQTFTKGVKVGSSAKADQGTSLAVDPLTGYVYVAYRNFDGAGALMVSRSTDGGASWSPPVQVQSFGTGAFPYDQGATGVSFRTLGFPTIAVSVKNGVSRVHVAWSQRKAAPAATAPYACTSQTASDCDARIVMKTSTDGVTWSPAQAQAIDGNTIDLQFNPANPNGRGHQVQPALAFAAGKLLATWLDQRLDHTEGVLKCPTSGDNTCAISARSEVRRPATNSNLDSNCKFPAGVSAPLVPNATCYRVDTNRTVDAHPVWSTYITDGTPYLVRRHTLDTYAALADPADVPVFASSRVSQYTFGNTLHGDPTVDGKIKPTPGYYDVVQKEINPPNLPMFSNGKSAFIGDYIDVAGQLIVASGDPAQPYKFNVGTGTTSTFAMGGFSPAFHVAFTDNRDVIPPQSGIWTTPACLTTDFIYSDPPTNSVITGVDTSKGAACQSGYSGNRNQNVYTAAIVGGSQAYSEANSKALSSTARGFVVSIRNLNKPVPGGPTGQMYTLTLPAQATGVNVGFDKSLLGNPPTPNTLGVFVQSRSTSARTIWATSTTPGAKIVVLVTAPDGYSSQVVLNADPNAPLATNGDWTPNTTTPDTTADSVGSVVLSNAVLTNNALSNNALTNNVLSNNALTNAVLSNVVLSNAALSNLDPVTAALSNNVLSNNVLSNVVLSNAVLSNAALSNNVLSNAVLSNVVLSNNAQNAALTNLDPTNAALSNAVLSNNVLSNVVLSNNALSNNALSNAVLSNNVLSNAVLSNVVLSNNALTNNAQNAALTNDPLRNVALSNAPLGDASQGGDPDALRAIETGSSDIVFNQFSPTDIQATNSVPGADFNFKETTFTLRNRGNTDTIVGIKLLLRDAVCGGSTGYHVPPYDLSPYQCVTPPGYKLQLVLRKVALVPVAIPATTNANIAPGTGISPRSIRIGLAQVNTEVSNVTNVPLIDPADPSFGKFQNDPNAAILSLAAGEWVYATIRAIGVNGSTPPDPAELLQWGVKTIAADASNPNGPLVIRTLSFPASPAFVALTSVQTPFQTFGGNGSVSGSAVCYDALGNTVLNGTGNPTSSIGAPGNYYIDTTAQTRFGPKNPPDSSHSIAWWPPTGTSLIVSGPSGPQASVPCPPGAIGFNPNPFTQEAQPQQAYSDSSVTFAPKYWGDFYLRANVSDASSPAQTDQQVIKVTVLPADPQLTVAAGFPATRDYNNNGQPINLRQYVSSVSKNGASPPVPQPVTLSTGTSPSCHMADADNLIIDKATYPVTNPPDCIVTVHVDGNEIYAPDTKVKPIFIKQAVQTIVVTSAPTTLTYNNFGNVAATLVAHVTSTTAPNSGLAVTFTSQTPVCTTGGTNGADVTIVHAGTCTINADQAGNPNYKLAPTAPITITINPATQTIGFTALPADHQLTFGNAPTTLAASLSSTTAPPSGLGVTYITLTPSVCTVSGLSVTIVTAGTCQIRATGGSSGDYNAPPQLTPSFIIDKAPTTTALVTSLTPAPTGSSVTFTATITPSALSPSAATGTVQFLDGTTSLGSPPIATGQASVATSSLTVGTHTLTAVYSGDSNYLGSTSAALTQVIDTPPVVLADAYGVLKDTALSVGAPGVLGNDGDVDPGQTLSTVLPVSPPANATSFQLNPDGSFSYTPTSGFTGVDTFSYQATDGQIAGDIRTVTITVLNPTATPVAENDAYSVTAGSGSPLLTVIAPGVLGNDIGQGLTAVPEVGGEPAHGIVTLNQDGSFTYTPATGYIGLDRFLYRAQDSSSNQSNLAMVTIAVLAAGAAPVAANDTYTADQETALTRVLPGVLANDTTATGAARVSGPLYGTLVFPGDGSFVYTPIAGFSGMDSFTYIATNGTAISNLAMATILVRAKTTTTISAPGVTYPTDGAVTVSVSASAGMPAGTVSLTVDGGTAVAQPLDGTGQSVFTVTGLNGGSHTLGATYAAQGNFGASSATGTLQVDPAPTTTTVTVGDANYDGNVHAGTASVTGPAGLNQSLTVTYTGTNPTIYGPSTTAPTNAGTYSASASYTATANYLASSDAKAFTINKAPTTTAVVVSDATYDGNPHGGTANVTGPAGLNQSLTVNYTGTGATIYGPSTTAPTNAGTYSASASYTATANYLASSDSKSFTVSAAPVQFTVSSSYFTPFGSATTIAGTLNRTGKPTVYPTDTPTITLSKGGPPIKTYTPSLVAPDGAFTVTDGLVAPDTYTVTFSYAGNANFLAATSVTATLRVEGFSAAAAMTLARAGHTATLLADGTVLVAGGVFNGTGVSTTSAEIYCAVVAGPCTAPDLGTFMTVGAMGTARTGHTATLLADGRVLVAGGFDATGTPTPTAEVYCATVSSNCLAGDLGTFKPANGMATARTGHTATLLPDATVLVAGGDDATAGFPPNASAEVYCTGTSAICMAPDLGKFKAVGPMTTARTRHAATLLADGTVLVTGGEVNNAGTNSAAAEIYCAAAAGICTSPDVGTFKPVVPGMAIARSAHTVLRLQDGRVLVAGGYGPSGTATASAEVYCTVVAGNCGVADLGKFKPVGNLVTGRANHTSTLLNDGWALAAGGRDATLAVLLSSELFHPGSGFDLFTSGASMAAGRSGHAATLLPDGRVLITGGTGAGAVPINSAEIYNGPP